MTQIRCEVKGVFVTMNDATTVPLVVLTDGGEQSLPIFIGLWEAVSINSAKNKEVLSRPFTHDLFLDLIVKFSISVHYLQIDSLEDGVYYAQLVLSADHHKEYLDCRPSDGIALALRADVPIFVDENVLASAGQKTADLPPMVDLSTFLRK
ncbi:MAG TPA: bifunctional nuclease family protein [Methanoregula sp.]|jgi:bifunctional DNase/RNase|nr:bifunctional nuclease family protein [Methanoregula sp.]